MCMHYSRRLLAALADPEADLDYYTWRLTNIVENIEVVRGLYDLYGYLVF